MSNSDNVPEKKTIKSLGNHMFCMRINEVTLGFIRYTLYMNQGNKTRLKFQFDMVPLTLFLYNQAFIERRTCEITCNSDHW